MKPVDTTYNYIQTYLRQVGATGRFTVTLDELKHQFPVSDKALLQNLYRLKTKNHIAQVRQGFYAIVPPEYSHTGMLPPTLIIDDMMTHLNRKYYVALFSAAAFHGAGHQQPMTLQVVTQKPALRNIETPKIAIDFFVKATWLSDQLVQMKTDAGYILVASPELTAFDLVTYSPKIGGVNRCLTILRELVEAMTPAKLVRVANNQKLPAIQRLGFLLDSLGHDKFAESLYQFLVTSRPRVVPLSVTHKNRDGSINKRWQIITNIEVDLP